MNSKLKKDGELIQKSAETNDAYEFMKLVKENEEGIIYLQYVKIISTKVADLIIEMYKK